MHWGGGSGVCEGGGVEAGGWDGAACCGRRACDTARALYLHSLTGMFVRHKLVRRGPHSHVLEVTPVGRSDNPRRAMAEDFIKLGFLAPGERTGQGGGLFGESVGDGSDGGRSPCPRRAPVH